MDKSSLKKFTHDASNFLSVDSSAYKQWVFRYTFLELEKDLGANGDITSELLFREDQKAKAKIIAKSDGVLAGLEEIRYFLIESEPSFKPSVKGKFELSSKFRDGNEFKKGDVIMEISGFARDLLMVERVVLNLLMRMSSVVTFTKKIVDTVKDFDVLITPTRKTLWGLLDKRAVNLGGGGTHRLNLSDAVLIKDNHLDLYNRNFDKVFEKIANSKLQCRFLEVEVDNTDEALEVSKRLCELLDKNALNCVGAVMLDNMKVEEIADTLKKVKSEGYFDRLLFEASGGIDESNVVNYAKTGIDIISMGCLTSGIEGVDMGMEISSGGRGGS